MYFVYTASDEAESATSHAHDVNTTIFAQLNITSLSERGNLVVDEWSCALTSKSLSEVSNPSSAQQDFCTGQMDVYAETGAGWAFWSYYLEDCATDDGWCFKKAVGNSLPSTFFSFSEMKAPATINPLVSTGAEMEEAFAILSNLSDSNAPISELVGFALLTNGTANSPPPPPTNFSLTSSGNGENIPLSGMNTPVILTGYTNIPNSNGNRRRDFEQAPFEAGKSFGSYRRHQKIINQRRSARLQRTGDPDSLESRHVDLVNLQLSVPDVVVTVSVPTPPSTSSMLSAYQLSRASSTPSPISSSPSVAVAGPFSTLPVPGWNVTNWYNTPYNQFSSLSPSQAAISRGYSDGFSTGKIFATSGGMSRLGFVGQYMADSFSALVKEKEMQEAQFATYQIWFRKGLSDAEAQIIATITSNAAQHAQG